MSFCRSGSVAWLSALLMVLAVLGGCGHGTVRHSFSFDGREAPGIELLDYRYGDSRQPGAQADRTQLRDGKVRQSANVSGDIRRPDSLYVRWRIESSGAIYEDAVDLARLMPRDITNHHVHFKVEGRQLFVYLVTTQRRLPGEAVIGPREYHYLKVLLLSSNFGREVNLQQE